MGAAEVSMAEVYDPLAPDQLANPYEVYRQAREHEPVFFSRKVLTDARVPGVWVVTRYDDVAAVAGDGTRFSSRDSLRPLVPIHPETREVLASGYPLAPTAGRTDGLAHRRVSVPLRQILHPRTGIQYGEFIATTVNELIDQMVATGQQQADIIVAVAHQLPFQVILRMFGIPESDQGLIRQWSDEWMRFLSTPLSPEDQVQAVRGMEDLFQYMSGLVDDRQEHPRDHDLVTVLAQHHEPGFDPLRKEELVNNLGGFMVAGHITTTALIGHAVAILLEDRRYWDDVLADPARIPLIVEETLRYRTPTKAFFRTATKDAVLSGVEIAEGDLLQLLYGSANHDEAKWEDPEHFNPYIDRRGTSLMSFSRGIHHCVGAPLARAEARIALEVLSRRLPGLRLVEQEYQYLPMVMVDGLQQLKVEW